MLVLVVPGVLEQLEAREHAARPAHERLEQRELLRRELDLGVAAPDAPRGRVEAQVADREHRRPLGRAAPGERPQPGEQLGERERLRQVVVGAGVEAADAILDRVARGQHQHRRPDAVRAQPAADLDAVHAGEHQVEHDRVVLGRARHPQRVFAGAGDVGGVRLLDEPAPQQRRELGLVLDDQHAHAAHCRRGR